MGDDVVGPPASDGYEETTKGFVFLHIPRTGGGSIRRALKLQEAEWHLPAWYRDLEGRFVFTFVRNPYDRARSIFTFLRREHPDPAKRSPSEFRAWVAGGMLHPSGKPPTLYHGTDHAIDVSAPQVKFLEGAPGSLWIGRHENLADEWSRLWHELARFGPLPWRELRHVHKSEGALELAAYYDGATLDRVADLYREDFDCLGYQAGRLEAEGS